MIPPDAEILHQSTGLSIRRNRRNKFVVVRLHYTADPAKRSAEWLEEARSGMDAARFAQEYEIDYMALRGKRAFPVLQTHRHTIIVPPPYPEFPASQPFYAGFDFGIRNPSAFIVFTWWDGVLYAVWELYQPCTNISAFCAAMRACPYWSSIRYIAADPHIASVNSFTQAARPSSVLQRFAEEGITKFVLAPTDESAFLALMHRHWSNPEHPTFRIFERCTNLISEFTNITYDDPPRHNPNAEPRERLRDAFNHAIDATKYFMLVRPSAPVTAPDAPPPQPYVTILNSYRHRSI